MDTAEDNLTPKPAALLAAQRPNATEAERLTPAGFAALIRQGAQIRPQAFGAYYSGRTDFCSCAIGAAVATRALMADLRAGIDSVGGPPPFSKADRSRFLSALDEALVRLR